MKVLQHLSCLHKFSAKKLGFRVSCTQKLQEVSNIGCSTAVANMLRYLGLKRTLPTPHKLLADGWDHELSHPVSNCGS